MLGVQISPYQNMDPNGLYMQEQPPYALARFLQALWGVRSGPVNGFILAESTLEALRTTNTMVPCPKYDSSRTYLKESPKNIGS